MGKCTHPRKDLVRPPAYQPSCTQLRIGNRFALQKGTSDARRLTFEYTAFVNDAKAFYSDLVRELCVAEAVGGGESIGFRRRKRRCNQVRRLCVHYSIDRTKSYASLAPVYFVGASKTTVPPCHRPCHLAVPPNGGSCMESAWAAGTHAARGPTRTVANTHSPKTHSACARECSRTCIRAYVRI